MKKYLVLGIVILCFAFYAPAIQKEKKKVLGQEKFGVSAVLAWTSETTVWKT